MDSGFPQPDVDFTPDVFAGAALLAPAFCDDLSTWRMVIHRNGCVFQELRPAYTSEFKDSVCIHLRSSATSCQLESIVEIADEIRFDTFDSEYQTDWSDQQHTSITLSRDDHAKRVKAYGPYALAEDGNTQMIGYVRLWELMLEISPYKGTVTTALPEKEVRKRLRTVFGRWL